MALLLGFIQTILFFVALITAFFIPGRIALGRKTNIFGLSLIISSIIVGMVLWGVQGWIFGYLHIRWMSYVYLIILVGVFIWQRGFGLQKTIKEVRSLKIDFIAFGLGLIGVIGQNINYFRMGWMTKDSMILNTFNVSDHIWHAALTNEIVQRFPPDEPGMYGILVKNYHFWFNLVTAEVIRVFHLPLMATQFMGMYVFGSIMLGFCIYLLVSVIYPSKLFLRLALFFFYFGGDATGWLTLITTHHFVLAGQRIEDATIFMDNPPRAFSVLVVITGAYLLFKNLKKSSLRLMIIMGLLFGTAIGFKVYTGIAVLMGLALLIGYKLIKREISFVTLGILAAGVAACIFIPVNSASGGLFLVPFELPRDFVAQQIFGLHDWELRWRIFYAHNNTKRLIQYGVYMTVVYLFAQYGIKLLGLFSFKKMRNVLGAEKSIFMYGTSAAGILLGTFFYQHAGTANIFNFYIAGGLFLTFLSALFVTLLIEKRSQWVQIIVILLVIAFVIPRFVFAGYVNVTTELLQTPTLLSNNDLTSYNFMKNLPPHQMVLAIHATGYDYDIDTPILSLMTNQYMFLSGEGIIDSHGASNEYRLNTVKTIETSFDAKEITNLLHSNHINYLYIYGQYNLVTPMSALPLKVVYHNATSSILQVQ